jgi:CCR4-NOT transcription complex subunit 7/8
VDSIDLLHRSGIDFARHAADGADTQHLVELLMSSGVILNSDVRWVTFHSGYDFGYLLKLLTGTNLSDTICGFFDLIKIYFPVIYGIKHLMRFCNNLHGGLNKLAELLQVAWVGIIK